MAKQARDTFVGTLPDGADVFVAKGETKPDGHPVVRQWPDLFQDFDMGENEKPPAKSEPAKAAAKPEVRPPAKAEPKPAAAAGKAPGRG